MELSVVPAAFSSQCRRSNPEAAGLWFEVCRIRDILLLRLDEICKDDWIRSLVLEKAVFDANALANESLKGDDYSFIDPEDSSYLRYLLELEPTQWKEQDHYRVLGLARLRYSASDDQIRNAYRQKVLIHHPDKRKARGKHVNSDEDYFACITKAYEVLSNQSKRRSYDSIDPEFDSNIPNASSITPSNFYAKFRPVFEGNARWSVEQPVPVLGDESSDFESVDKFYSFWFNFNSWREFSYLDEEDKEKGENREERRWIDKQNKVMRDKRRKDEIKRIRKLVETAYNCDPRIQKFKEDEKLKKNAQKLAKQEEQRRQREAEEQARRDEEEKIRLVKEAEEAAERERILIEKREKDRQKKAIQKERKQLETFCKQSQFFTDDESEQIRRLAEIDNLCKFLSLERITLLNQALASAESQKPYEIISDYMKQMEEEKESERKKFLNGATIGSGNSAHAHTNGAVHSAKKWTEEMTQCLVKAMILFPVGTKSRWDVIAAFIGEKTGTKINGKDVVQKVKDMQQKEGTLTDDSGQKAFENFQKSKKVEGIVESDPSIRTETPAEFFDSEARPWTNEEQKLLEQALRTFNSNTGDRWDRIAECIPGRTKKECMKRYKELAELIKAKKAAQEQVAKLKISK